MKQNLSFLVQGGLCFAHAYKVAMRAGRTGMQNKPFQARRNETGPKNKENFYPSYSIVEQARVQGAKSSHSQNKFTANTTLSVSKKLLLSSSKAINSSQLGNHQISKNIEIPQKQSRSKQQATSTATKSETAALKICDEILSSERSYVKGLKTLVKNYMRHLQVQLRSNSTRIKLLLFLTCGFFV